MSGWRTVAVLSQTAWQECALLGHREIDVEHVLLAAMDDEEVARVMAGHGVTREGTRQRVDAVVREQLARIGVDLGDAVQVQRRPASDLLHEAVGELAVSERARTLIAEARSMPQVALASLDLPDGTVAALLERQGADVAEVRADLVAQATDRAKAGGRAETGGTASTDAPDEVVDASTLPGLALIKGAPGQSRRRSRFLPLPWEEVWPHVATAEGARQWLLSDESTRVSGPGELSGEITVGRSRSRGTYVRRLLGGAPPSACAPGYVLWQEDWQLTGRGRSGPGQWTHLTLTPVQAGTRVDLVIGALRHGRAQRLLKPVIGFGQSIASRNALYQLGLAIEGAAPPAAPWE